MNSWLKWGKTHSGEQCLAGGVVIYVAEVAGVQAQSSAEQK